MNNMQKSPLQKAVERAHALGRRAVIPFITAGFPDKESFWTHLSRIDEAGADIIEIGVPFSDPVADGPVIEQASRDALARGVSLKWILDGLKARKGGFSAELVLMGYVNPFYQYGLEQLARDAEEAGVSGFIVPDMPLEESGMFREAFSPHGLTLGWLPILPWNACGNTSLILPASFMWSPCWEPPEGKPTWSGA